MNMEGENKDLTPEQIEAQRIEDEAFEEKVKKKFNVGSISELVKKADVPPVLTPEQIAAEEEKRNSEVLKFSLESNWFSKSDYDAYQEALKKDPIEVVRQKFIDDNPDLGDKAANIFNSTFKVDEDDDIEDGENAPKPNLEKQAAKKLAKKLADDELKSKYDKVINASKRYEEHQAEVALTKINTDLVTKAISSIPKRLEHKVGEKDAPIGVELTDEDFAFATKTVLDGIKGRKDVTAEEVKENTVLILKMRNLDKIISEHVKVALANAEEAYERGVKGLSKVVDAGTGGISKKRAAMIKQGIIS